MGFQQGTYCSYCKVRPLLFRTNAKTCGDKECRYLNFIEYKKQYDQKPKVKEKRRLYNKKRREDQNFKERAKELRLKWLQTDRGKETTKRYRSTKKWKEYQKKYNHDYYLRVIKPKRKAKKEKNGTH